jgi:hypothetical protein
MESKMGLKLKVQAEFGVEPLAISTMTTELNFCPELLLGI